MSDALTREWQSLVALALGKLVPKENPTKMPITETLEGLLFNVAVRLRDDADKIRSSEGGAIASELELKAGDTIERVDGIESESETSNER